ncbi:MAG: hypothetical protein ACKO7W_21025 [Elainella sp.]
MRSFWLFRRLLPLKAGLLILGLWATALPTQAQSAGHNSRRDYYYPQTRDPYRASPSDAAISGQTDSPTTDGPTIVRPVIIDNRIQNSTVIGPVIVSPTARPNYPQTVQPANPQPARRTDAACMSFNELRIACQL